MGTNFYMMTSDKEAANEWFEDSYELTDYPQWGYSIHVAKTSGGWKPLFQEHSRIHSVNDIKIIMSTGKFSIYDEYGTVYTWNEFVKRVVDWNKDNPTAYTHVHPDRTMPNFHQIYGRCYPDDDFISADGYEFSHTWFS